MKERLIDANLLLSDIEKSREKNPHENSMIRANHTIEHDHIAHLVMKQDIAYDVDKVVEKLEKLKEECADPLQEYDTEYFINRAIEIVKEGLNKNDVQ